MDCEICGRQNADIDAFIEKVKMRVCDECSKLGKVVYVDRPASQTRPRFSAPAREKIDIELVEDYAEIIRKARNSKGLTRKQLGDQIDEKESYLERIEKGTTPPNDKMAKKLMRKFDIKLYEEVAPSFSGGKPKPDAEITFGDIVSIKKKPKK